MASICSPGNPGGLLLPMFGESEQNWPNAVRIILYFFGMGWCFLGVSIIADVFMGAIEQVTSKKKRGIRDGKHVTVTVWNATVANLTLMALGSSAPEILLAVIELLGNGMLTGQLGPSTIVGSAAFNLLCICAVCIYVIPKGETRTIKEMPVFVVTASCSVFAYFWLVVILMMITPDQIDVAEGLFTFLFFPLLVTAAFVADRGYFAPYFKGKELEEKEEQEVNGALPLVNDIPSSDSAAHYRREAIHFLVAAKRIEHGVEEHISETVVQFAGTEFEVRTNTVSEVTMLVERNQATSTLVVRYKTSIQEDSAALIENKVHTPIEGELILPVDEIAVPLTIPITKTQEALSGSILVELTDVHEKVDETAEDATGEKRDSKKTTATQKSTATHLTRAPHPVKISLGQQSGVHLHCVTHADGPGTLSFLTSNIELEPLPEETTLKLIVNRTGGTEGEVSCKYKTVADTAMPELDYREVEGTLHFAAGQAQAKIEVQVLEKRAWECADSFRIYLEDVEGGAVFDANADGGEDCAIATITIEGGKEAHGFVGYLDWAFNLDQMSLGVKAWKEAFWEAVYVNGSPEGMAEANKAQWAVHIIALPWKLFFCLVPPVIFMDGWVCFVVAIGFIGFVTCIIGDIASLFGCCIGLPDSIVAITFVALGTSLPDTFASMAAASQEPYADSSIGNVTGSNCVNVFLGLGLPWTIGSCYWTSKGMTFIVPAGDLGFSVTAFLIASLICIGVIVLRRVKGYGELGGPIKCKTAAAILLVSLWFFYIGLSCWKVGMGPASAGAQALAIFVGTLIIAIECGVLYFVFIKDGQKAETE